MKLRAYLREIKKISYSEYKLLPEITRIIIYNDFEQYNRRLQAQTGWRSMTEEERKWADEVGEKEAKRFSINSKIGGVSGVNYIALHYRYLE